MSLVSEIEERGHERVIFAQDPESGLKAILAVHNTAIGPGLGGCRMHAYPSFDDALFDVLRLSQAMSYKNSLCGINFGGGKSVIIADRCLQAGRNELFKSFGRFVQGLGGIYITAEDMGTSVSDMSIISEECEFVAGRDPNTGGGGDPSPFTALGVFHGMRACLERAFNSGDFSGRSVAVQGVGHVGRYLCELLEKAGSKLYVADPDPKALAELKESVQTFEVVSAEQIPFLPVDVFAPCARGGIITQKNACQLSCKIVAGAANNQLLDREAGEELTKRDIIYAPDFAINAGGVILCADEFEPGGFTRSRVEKRVKEIYNTISRILDKANKNKELTEEVAIHLANERIQKAREEKG